MKRLLAALTILSLFVLPIMPVSAQYDPFGNVCDPSDPLTSSSEVCQAANDPTNPVSGEDGVLVTVLNIISFVIGAASVLMVMVGGLKYITANGDSNSISSAKNTVLYALIGLAVFVLSQAIIIFVVSRL